MELSFITSKTSDGKATLCVLTGELTSVSLSGAHDSIPVAEVEMDVTNVRVEEDDFYPKTLVIDCAPLTNIFLWVKGVREYKFGMKTGGGVNSCQITFNLLGMFKTYEEACAAEMKARLEKNRQ